MKAILLSDLLVLKTQAKSILLVLLLWLAITVYNGNGLFFSALSVVYAMMLPLTCIATYEKSHFDRYVMTAPLGRTEAALSHYVFAMICELALSLIGFILSIALGMDVMEALFSIAACFCVGVVMVCVLLPVIYKFGTEKARLTMVAVFVLFLIAFGVLLSVMDIDIDNVEDALVLLPVLTLAVLAVSAAVSVGIYRKKEF